MDSLPTPGSEQPAPAKPIDSSNANQQLIESQFFDDDTTRAQQLLTDSLKPKKSKKIATIIIMVILILLLMGGGAWAYLNYFVPAPEQMIIKIIENIGQNKSLEFSVATNNEVTADGYNYTLGTNTISGSASPGQKININTEFNITGGYDFINTNDVKGYAKVNLQLKGLPQQALPLPDPLSLGLEGRLVKQNLYLTINNFPDLKPAVDLENIKNQWVNVGQIKADDLEKKINEWQGSNGSVQNFTADQWTEIKNLFAKSKIIKVISRLPSDTIDGVKVDHYKLGINVNKIEPFISQMGSQVVAPNDVWRKQQITDFIYFWQNNPKAAIYRDLLKQFNFEVWVDAQNARLYKLTYVSANTLTADQAKTLFTDGASLTGSISWQGQFILTLSHYNQPLKIDEPTGVITLTELITKIMSGAKINTVDNTGSFNEKFKSADDSSTFDSDSDGLLNGEEDFYGTNRHNPDTDGDGYSDGNEVKNGFDPLRPGSVRLQ